MGNHSLPNHDSPVHSQQQTSTLFAGTCDHQVRQTNDPRSAKADLPGRPWRISDRRIRPHPTSSASFSRGTGSRSRSHGFQVIRSRHAVCPAPAETDEMPCLSDRGSPLSRRHRNSAGITLWSLCIWMRRCSLHLYYHWRTQECRKIEQN